jgi:hypothetical protein
VDEQRARLDLDRAPDSVDLKGDPDPGPILLRDP